MPKKTNNTKQTKVTTVTKTSMEVEKEGIPENEVAEIKEAFDLFDIDKSGEIDVAELKQALNGLGIKEDNQTFDRMMAEIDENKSGTIDFNEFLGMMTAKISDTDSEEELRKVFEIFLSECDGDKLGLEDLERLNDQVQLGLTKEELNEMIIRADTDRDGKVSFDEFFAIITKKI